MKSFICIMGMVIFTSLFSCKKESVQSSVSASAVDNVLSHYHNVIPFDSKSEEGNPFNPCTDETVHIYGNIHMRYAFAFKDGVRSVSLYHVWYDVEGIGDSSHLLYKITQRENNIQNNKWNGEWYEPTDVRIRNYMEFSIPGDSNNYTMCYYFRERVTDSGVVSKLVEYEWKDCK